MRLTRYLVPAVAISVGAVLLIGAVATHSHRGTDHDDPVVTGPGTGTGQLAGSVARAYLFLNQMMDRHAGGTTPRLVQSYLGGLLGLDGNTSSAVYDDALVIDAYLAEGTRDGVARAEVIGNGLLYLQAHDPSHDGRIMDQYQPTALEHPGDIHVTAPTSNTGDMAWAGDALAQLYSATGRKAYLDGAVAIGDWIQAHCRDDRGPGGYTGGYTGSGSKIEWKSTEHNIDVYAFFRLLARETGNPVWSSRSAWARRFILAMWDTAAGRFYLGTTDNGATPEYSPAGRGRQQLVVSGSPGPRVRAIARLGRAPPRRDHGWLPRREHLHRQPHGRVVRGNRPPRGRAGTQRRASRPGPGGSLPLRSRLRPSQRAERGRPRGHGRVVRRAE